MNPVPAAIKAAHEPQVNLLPPEVEARRARGRQRGVIGLVFFAFLVLVGFGVFWASSQESAAKKDLQAAVDKEAQLQADIDTYQYVLDIQGELNNARNARTFVGSTDILYSDLQWSIVSAMPAGISIKEITLTISSVTTLAPQDTGPFAVPDIGSIAISGQLDQFVSGADLEEILNGIPGLARARIVTVQRQDDESGQNFTFEGTVRMTALALSGRFGAEWMVNQAILDAADALGTRVLEAQAAVNAAEEAVAAGEPGAAQVRDEAIATYTSSVDDYRQFVSLGLLVTSAKDEITLLEAEIAALEADIPTLEKAVARKADNAEENLAAAQENLAAAQTNLAAAQERLNPLTPIADTLVKAINAWDEDEKDLIKVETRIVAAENYVADAQQGVDDAQAALAAGGEGAEEALQGAQARLARAEGVLLEEQSYLPATDEAESASRAALDTALAVAAVVAPVGTIVEES